MGVLSLSANVMFCCNAESVKVGIFSQVSWNQIESELDVCVYEFVKDYKNRVAAHCSHMGYAKNIGGGCPHFISRAVTPTVLKHATEKCDS